MLPSQQQKQGEIILKEHSRKVEMFGATNIVQSSLPSVVKCLNAMKSDPVLGRIDFNEVSFSEIVFSIMKKGSVLERAALARNLTPEACFFFPSAWSQITGTKSVSIDVAIDEILTPMIELMADHFGAKVNGNMHSMCYSFLTEFGGLSFADFMICFDRVKAGHYKKETEHIMTRGINPEFITNWLNQYADDKESSRATIYEQNKPDKRAETSPDAELEAKKIRESIEKVKQERAKLQREADEIYDRWENSLYTSGVLRQHFKSVSTEYADLSKNGTVQFNADGTVKKRFVLNDVICEQDNSGAKFYKEYAIRVPVAGGMAKKMKRIIFEFIENGDSKKTVEAYEELTNKIRVKYKDFEDIESAVDAELKTLIASFGVIKRQFSPNAPIEAVLRKLHPNATEHQILKSVVSAISVYDAHYFSEYLPMCIKKEYPRLTVSEFTTTCALPQFVEHGFTNPFKRLLD